uniref:Uncharacterized protein n=1 Tax=mine drainage metagenome TaxID=410659 RepID=E6QC51_9ZZZZ
MKEGPGNQRSLVATMTALKRLARAAFQNGMPGTTALRAMEAVRTTSRFQGRSALLVGAKTLYEIGERQSFLKLPTVHRHGTPQYHKNQWIISGWITV